MNTTNRRGNAELWGTDKLTYPSRNVEDEETLGKRTDVRENCPNRKPMLGELEHGAGLRLIGIRSALMFGQNSSGSAWEAVLWPFLKNWHELALQAA